MKLVSKIMTAAVVSAGLFFMGGCSKAEQEKAAYSLVLGSAVQYLRNEHSS